VEQCTPLRSRGGICSETLLFVHLTIACFLSALGLASGTTAPRSEGAAASVLWPRRSMLGHHRRIERSSVGNVLYSATRSGMRSCTILRLQVLRSGAGPAVIFITPGSSWTSRRTGVGAQMPNPAKFEGRVVLVRSYGISERLLTCKRAARTIHWFITYYAHADAPNILLCFTARKRL